MLLGYILFNLYISNMKLNTKDQGRSGIYIIRNLINGKVYIGKAKCIYKRMKQHITQLNTKSKDENAHMINAWHKYGKQSFAYTVLEYLELDPILIAQKELFYQRQYNVTDSTVGYNKRIDSETGMITSDETRKKLSAALVRRYQDPANRKKVSDDFKLFWKNNPDKLKQMSEKVADAIRIYKIAKLNYDTKIIIEVFDSRKDLQTKNPEYYIQAILGCCQGTKNSYKGFKWCYIDIKTNQPVMKHNNIV